MNLKLLLECVLFVASLYSLAECQNNSGILDDQDLTPPIATTSGPVVGITTNNAHAFYNIPYAKPPVRDLRWKDPIPIEPSDEEVKAYFGQPVRCYQQVSELDFLAVLSLSEDCLVLNVFVPPTVQLPVESTTRLLPVMFFIHGGNFRLGSGTDNAYEANELARVTNAIVVTINYRLGPLGFLTLQEEGEEYIEGNQGLKDQRLALEWVQSNIANFGGDKNQVTIFGQDAGAQSVMLHLVSPKSKNLFRASIQQSNPGIYSFYHMSPEAALRVSQRLIEALGCNATNTTERLCLLDADPAKILSIEGTVEESTAAAEGSNLYIGETFFPIIDGKDITDFPINLLKSGKWNDETNMIIGVNTEESRDYQFSFPHNTFVDEDTLRIYFESSFGSKFAENITKKYIQEYPPSQRQYRAAFGHALSHYYYDCPSKLIARYAANTGTGNVYFYANSHAVLLRDCVATQGGNTSGCEFAYHATELPYVFRTVANMRNLTEADEAVQDQFSTYWGSFTRTQSPSNNLENPIGSFSAWPRYLNCRENGLPPRSYLEISSPNSTVKHGYNDAICEFWDSINYARPIVATTNTPIEMMTCNGITQPMLKLTVSLTAIFLALCML